MTYYTKSKNGQLVRHWSRDGRQVITPVPTETIACDRCGWSTSAIGGQPELPTCICGGTLRLTTAIKKALE